MDLKQGLLEIVASILIVFQRTVLLIFYPYKTMRAIAKETDYTQILVIFLSVLLYYFSLDKVKDLSLPPFIQFGIVVFNVLATVCVTALFNYIYHKKIELKPFLFLFSYALLPTIIWFYLNTFLFVTLPPPRHITFLGKLFSITFITLSVSILAWKVILWYLAVRYSTKLQFYEILYITIIYLSLTIPYSMLLYHFGLFRIPFI